MFATKDSFPPYMKHKHRRTTGTTKLEPQEKDLQINGTNVTG